MDTGDPSRWIEEYEKKRKFSTIEMFILYAKTTKFWPMDEGKISEWAKLEVEKVIKESDKRRRQEIENCVHEWGYSTIFSYRDDWKQHYCKKCGVTGEHSWRMVPHNLDISECEICGCTR